MFKVSSNLELYFPVFTLSNFLFYNKCFCACIKYNTSYFRIFSFVSRIMSVFMHYKTILWSVKGSNNIIKPRKFSAISTRKLFKQKGLGRARIGSRKSPILRGGVASFIYKSKFRKIKSLKNIRYVVFGAILNIRSNVFVVCRLLCFHSFEKYSKYFKKQLCLLGKQVDSSVSIYSIDDVVEGAINLNFWEGPVIILI